MRERWASAGNVAIPSTEKTAEGWVEEIPPSELANFIENRQDEAIAYLMQQGIAEWLNNLEYQVSSFIQYNGVVYKALSVNINQQPNVTPLIWQPAFEIFGAAQDVQDNFDDFISQDDPLPQYVQENDAILTGDTQAERIVLDVLNVNKATPSVGNPKGIVFGTLQTTGLYQATDDKVVYQQAGVITANMPNLATIPTSTNDKTIVTAEWVQQLIAEATRTRIGALYFTTNNVNPNVELGYGTWQKYAEGRAIVGHSGDVTSATPDWAKVGDNIFGSYTHILSVPEMPSHGHVVTTGGVAGGRRGETEGGNHTENNNGSGSRVGGTAQPTGGGLPHNNVQPSIVVFIWRRTA